MDRRRWALVVVVGIATVLAAGATLTLLRDGPQDPPGSASAPAAPDGGGDGPVTVAVDAGLRPGVTAVAGVHAGDPARPMGVLADLGDGDRTEVVRNELIVVTEPADVFATWLERWQAETVHIDGEAELDTLVRIDTSGQQPFADLGQRLDALDDGFEEPLGISDADLAVLLSAFVDAAAVGLEPALVVTAERAGLATMTAAEAPSLHDADSGDELPSYDMNPFTWPDVASEAPHAYALDAAWRLVVGRELMVNRIPVLFVDGGFYPSPDWPDDTEMVRGSLSEENHGTCSGGVSCPAHGSTVLSTAAAAFDNGYGGVGTGWPVVAPRLYDDRDVDVWVRFVRIRRLVRDHDIRIVNMSFGGAIAHGRDATQRRLDRALGRITDEGALLLAAAGNRGVDLDRGNDTFWHYPCESNHVLCVGGLDPETPELASGSNHDDDGPDGVEIHAPFCHYGPWDPLNAFSTPPDALAPSSAVRWRCGTSDATPWVAGVAAMVMAADPSLSAEDVREALTSTARARPAPFGTVPQVQPAAALRRILGPRATPSIAVLAPTPGMQVSGEDFVELRADARDEAGYPIPVTWISDRDGPLGSHGPGGSLATDDLSAGLHTLTARGVAVFGASPEATVQVPVIDRPAQLSIISPLDGDEFPEHQSLLLVGDSFDPDTNLRAPDSVVRWSIHTMTGSLVLGGLGHELEVSPGQLGTGTFEARFGHEDGAPVQAVTFVVTAGSVDPPAPVITAPSDGAQVVVTNDKPGIVELRGEATDVEQGDLVELAGDRLRWEVTGGGQRLEPCRGSGWPPAGGGGGDVGIVQPTDCSVAQVELYIRDGETSSTWTVTLWARDAGGATTSTSVTVTVRLGTG